MSNAIKNITKLKDIISVKDYGGIGDGIADDTAAVIAAIAALQDNSTLDLGGLRYKIFTTVTGTAIGNAVEISGIPRLVGRTGVTIKNGTIFAANPSVSPSKVRYPSTLTIDGCSGITLIDVTLSSKGESFGDADASIGLDFEARRTFCAQNGGHALLVVRSGGTQLHNCTFDRSGSVAPCYVMSCDETEIYDCYSIPRSLGYAAFAFDSWAGSTAVSGFPSHTSSLYNCRTDNGGSTYGSKGGVFAEDEDVEVHVLGGTWADAYANASAHFIGAAFTSINANVIVTGAVVENCAAIGLTYHSAEGASKLSAIGVRGTGLRTSMHINGNESYGNSEVRYEGCSADIIGTSLWAELELSVSTVIANQKVASGFTIDIIGCTTRGASTFAVNSRAIYGGYNVIGGEHIVYNRIFDTLGAGGSAAGTMRGIKASGGVNFKVMSPTPAPALTVPASSALNVIRNQDSSAVLTYQLVDFDTSVTIEAVAAADTFDIISSGSGLVERINLLQRCIGCAQITAPGTPRTGTVRVVSLDGVAGSLYKVTFAYIDRKNGNGMTLQDDVYATRRQQGIYGGPVITSGELRCGVFLNGTSPNLTVGAIYPVIFTS